MASEDLFADNFTEEIPESLEEEQSPIDLEVLPEEVNGIAKEPSVELEAETEDLEHEDAEEVEAEGEPEPETEKSPTNETSSKEKSNEPKLFQLPFTRIRNLMKCDPDLQIASNEAVFLVTRATELFIESLAREAYTFTAQTKKKTIQKRDVDLAIASVDSLIFLEGAMNF